MREEKKTYKLDSQHGTERTAIREVPSNLLKKITGEVSENCIYDLGLYTDYKVSNKVNLES